jgi:hypothetical protein
MFLWPPIYLNTLNSEVVVATVLQDGLRERTPWFVQLKLHKDLQRLPWDTEMRTHLKPSDTKCNTNWLLKFNSRE